MSVTCEASVTQAPKSPKSPKSKKPRFQDNIEQEGVREPEAREEQEPTSPDSHNVSVVVVDAGGEEEAGDSTVSEAGEVRAEVEVINVATDSKVGAEADP